MERPSFVKKYWLIASIAIVVLLAAMGGSKLFGGLVGDPNALGDKSLGSVSSSEDSQIESVPKKEIASTSAKLITTSSSEEKQDLYSKSASLKEVYSDARALAEAGDGKASMFLVRAEQQCLIARANPLSNGAMLNAIGEALADDEDGRKFFNQLIAYASAGIWDYDELTDYVSGSSDYCKGFDEPINHSDWFDYLRTAAVAGITDAQVGIWSHSLPEHQQAVLANIKNPEDLTYLRTIEKERLWTVEKIGFLESAAAKGDYRAMILLGDIFSTDKYVQPDVATAVAYYEAASESMNLPFIQSRINSLEAAGSGSP